MLDILIVGAGICGLALANRLHFREGELALYEARERLGGRVLTEQSENGLALDLGPTWFWPDIHPHLLRLSADLGIASFPQHDDGSYLQHREADAKVETSQSDNPAGLHGGAHRLAGGMGALVRALAARLPAERVHLGHALTSLIDRGDHVEAHFARGDATVVVAARRVVLALPPRLLAEKVRFEPALPAELTQAMRDTHTWMAAQAKAVVAYPQAFWRAEGKSGNAFVSHYQAVLGEVFDACDADGRAALGGFLALDPAQRVSFRVGLPIMIASQLALLFGGDLTAASEMHYQDWATEPWTCSTLDAVPPAEHPDYGDPRLTAPQWDGRLLLGGSETAAHGGGYVEGALDAAARLARQLAPAVPSSKALLAMAHTSINQQLLAAAGTWIAQRRAGALDGYKQALTAALSAQENDQITQRALLATVDRLYLDTLAYLAAQPFEREAVAVEQGRSALTPELLGCFVGFLDELLTEAVKFNRGSCAISNFPAEAKPSAEYIYVIRRDLAAAWREFALAVNDLMLAPPVTASAS